ncbi:MAG: ATP-grasp domain-containing protein [Gemmatales bacterium]|nr:ATP-grasp domain-containing protein [Gemmatales bacterium]MDW8223554.1 ATP-grasp domain-containing protein [Gemmatales bacterium]
METTNLQAGQAAGGCIVLVGASVRALAFAVLRAGWSPWCVDLFADADLRAVAACQRITSEDYPYRLAEWLACRTPKRAPVMYTGRLENHPQVLHRIHQVRPLWGNDAATVRAARDPQRLQLALSRWNFPFADWSYSCADIPTDGSWLVRGPRGVQRWRGQRVAAKPAYWQRYVAGEPASAVYVADSQHCVLLGATWQLVGVPFCQAREFQWCGNVGPMPCSPELRTKLLRLGEGLTREFGLRGIFGVDFVLQGDMPWVTEINPRYPASLEVLELALGLSWFPMHAEVFPGGACADANPGTELSRPLYVGKAVLFTSRPVKFRAGVLTDWAPMLTPWLTRFDVALADVPEDSALISAGAPLLTVLAQAETLEACQLKLQQAAHAVYSLLEKSD